MKRPKEYRVTWDIELSAMGPRLAAKEALKIQRDWDSIATAFHVQEVKRPSNVKTIDVRNDPCMQWTVILLYPDYETDDYGADLYVEWVDCKDPYEAVKIVQKKASLANTNEDTGEVFIPPDDFRPIGILRGHHRFELDATDF